MTKTYLESIGKDICGATNLQEALEKGGLDWTAKSSPVEYYADIEELQTAPAYKVVYKDSDKSTLGVVGANYGIIQNTEAFAIADALIGSKVEFRRAGQVLGQTFIIMKGENTFLLNEEVENYIIIRNSFDGSSRLQISWVPVMKTKAGDSYFLDTNNQRVFAIKHSSAWIKKYGKTFVESLISDGNQALQAYANAMLNIKYTPDQLTRVLDQFLPLKYDKNGQPKDKANEAILEKRQHFANTLNSQDLAQQKTAYGVYKALQELETHSFQSAKVVKPTRNEYKKVKKLFTNGSMATEAVNYLEKLVEGKI